VQQFTSFRIILYSDSLCCLTGIGFHHRHPLRQAARRQPRRWSSVI
jgi:hypothetical protein